MRINNVVIVPAFSKHANPGRYIGRYCEYDAMEGYLDQFIDQIDADRIPYKVESDVNLIQPNSLILYTGIEWFDDNPEKLKCNYSTISYGPKENRRISKLAIEVMSDWGKCYGDPGHKVKEKIKVSDKVLNIDNTLALSIKPFCLNGPRADDYMKNLVKCGDILAQFLYEFMLARDEVRLLPTMYR